MGAEYYVYIEAKEKKSGKWLSIDPLICSDGNILTKCVTYYTCSSFRAAYDKIRFEGGYTGIRDMSDELADIAKSFCDDEKDVLFPTIYVSKMSQLAGDRKCDMAGYASKQEILEFENGAENIITDWLSPAEFRELNKKEQAGYKYYEWLDPDGWLLHFKNILDTADHRISDYSYAAYGRADLETARIIVFLSV